MMRFDINSLDTSFGKTEEGIWLATHSYEYGFIHRYPEGKESITGYEYEPWHFRYLGKEIAKKVYDSGMTYDEYCAKKSESSMRENRTYGLMRVRWQTHCSTLSRVEK